MFLMTVVQLVPLILYYVYRTLMQVKSGSSSNQKGSGHVALLAIATYVLYIVCEYIVLWFFRTREYYADRFAGEVTRTPNSLASALVKIAYGLAGQESGKEEKATQRSTKLDAVGAHGHIRHGHGKFFCSLGICCRKVFSHGNRIWANDRTYWEPMKWDLWNPWAKYFELHSTHPLGGKQNESPWQPGPGHGTGTFHPLLSSQAGKLLGRVFRGHHDLVLAVVALAGAGRGCIFVQIDWLYGVAFAVTGFLMLFKMGFSYPAQVFPEMSVSSLLKKVKVSGVRGVPCRLKGKVIGKGVAGLIWSEDFVLQDETGIIFLDYRQPLRIWEFFFGLMRAQDLQDAEVEIKGWYRRAPMPYIELKTLRTERKSRECYVYTIKTITAYLMLIGGAAATILLLFT